MSIVPVCKFACQPQFVSDQDGRPIVSILVKGTFVLRRQRPVLAESQLPISATGEFWGEPGKSSYKYEPETAFVKPAADLVLIGHAFPQAAGDSRIDVLFRVGPVEKIVRVFGNRHWVKRLGIVDMTKPEPIDKIPLIYERAFGGWDAAEPDPLTSRFEPRNPAGVGFKRKKFEEGLPLPNLEDPKHPLKIYGDTPPPAGFGFIAPNWQPRASYAGTYNVAWEKERAPLLPLDFDLKFFNAASPGLVTPQPLRGDEPVVIENASPSGRIAFQLPGVRPPQILAQLRGRRDERRVTKLDTVVVNTDENLLLLMWRTFLPLRSGPHEVTAIEVTTENV